MITVQNINNAVEYMSLNHFTYLFPTSFSANLPPIFEEICEMLWKFVSDSFLVSVEILLIFEFCAVRKAHVLFKGFKHAR